MKADKRERLEAAGWRVGSVEDFLGSTDILSSNMRITMRQIEAAYDVASQVFERKLALETGAKFLQDTYGLNVSSARNIINDYRLMLQGREFKRTMSAPAIDYFLTGIAADRGPMALTLAINAVLKHIKYYEGFRQVTLHKMRTVVSRHEAYLADSNSSR